MKFSRIILTLGLILILSLSYSFAQTTVDSSFAFEIDPSKDYSLYIPSSYDSTTPNKVMVGLHPFNTSRWDGKAWRDTLVNFAEMNGLLLVCPDGGVDGRIDDSIDTAFTTALLDSVKNWYNVDEDKIYMMGFSWGSMTTYTYGLTKPDIYGGYLPVGAAISGLTGVTSTHLSNSKNKPVYIVHGALDAPSTRFTPIRDALVDSGAIVNSLLMPGVGHTIDFTNRNAILTTAFEWIDSVNCAAIGVGIPTEKITQATNIYPVPVLAGEDLIIERPQTQKGEFPVLMNAEGKLVLQPMMEESKDGATIRIKTDSLSPGRYFVKFADIPAQIILIQ